MILNEIIYDIREKLKINSDDIDISNEYLAHLIGVKRALLLKQRYSKFIKTVPSETIQLMCIDLEEVNSIEGETCFGTVLKSKNKIPAVLQLDNKSAILAIKVQDKMTVPINVIDIERFPYILHNKWLANQIYAAISSDGYLYFTSGNIQHKFLESVKVSAILFNPEEGDKYTCDTTSPACDFFEKEYPVESHMIHDIVNLILKELTPYIKLEDDKLNNASEDPR